MTIWFRLWGCRSFARWDSRRAFPADGDDVRRVGRRKDTCRAMFRRDSIVDGRGMSGDSMEDVVDVRKRRTP